AVREAVPRTEPPEPRLDHRVQHATDETAAQADEEHDPRGSREGDVADAVPIRRERADQAGSGGKAGDAHHDTADEPADDDPRDDARKRRGADVPSHGRWT